MSDLVNKLEEGIIAALLAAMTLLTFLQVVMRYVFNSGFVWALETTTYMFGWLVLFGMSYGVKKGSHIGIDVVVKLFPAATQRIIGILAALLCILYAAIMLYGGWRYADTMHTLGVEAEDIAVERWILVSILPVGFALLLYRLSEITWRILTGRQEGLKLADEAKDTIDQLYTGDAGAPKPGG